VTQNFWDENFTSSIVEDSNNSLLPITIANAYQLKMNPEKIKDLQKVLDEGARFHDWSNQEEAKKMVRGAIEKAEKLKKEAIVEQLYSNGIFSHPFLHRLAIVRAFANNVNFFVKTNPEIELNWVGKDVVAGDLDEQQVRFRTKERQWSKWPSVDIDQKTQEAFREMISVWKEKTSDWQTKTPQLEGADLRDVVGCCGFKIDGIMTGAWRRIEVTWPFSVTDLVNIPKWQE
jgi:hypothetical protein